VEITAGYDFLVFNDENVIIKDPIPNGYGCVVVFNCFERPPVICKWQVTLRDLQQAGTVTVSGSCDSHLELFMAERQGELRPAVAFSNTCLKHRSV
jgi:hypothetical protein